MSYEALRLYRLCACLYGWRESLAGAAAFARTLPYRQRWQEKTRRHGVA